MVYLNACWGILATMSKREIRKKPTQGVDLSVSSLQQQPHHEESELVGNTLEGLMLTSQIGLWEGLLNKHQFEALRGAARSEPTPILWPNIPSASYFGAREIILTPELHHLLSKYLFDRGLMLPDDHDWHELQIPGGDKDQSPILLINGIGKSSPVITGSRIRARFRHVLGIVDPMDPQSHLEMQTGRWQLPFSAMKPEQLLLWLDRFAEYESKAMVHELIVATCLENPSDTMLAELKEDSLNLIVERFDQLGQLLSTQQELDVFDFSDLMSKITLTANAWIKLIHQAKSNHTPMHMRQLDVARILLSRLPSPRR